MPAGVDREAPGRRAVRRSLVIAWTVIGLVAAGVVSVSGQEDAQAGVLRVQIGDSLRVHLQGNLPITAAFRSWDGEYMMLGIEGIDDSWPVSVFDMDELELYTLRTSQESFRHGAVLGAVSGIFIGAALGLALNATGITDDPDGPPAQLMTDTLRGAGLGFALGAVGGGLYFGRNPGWGWVSIRLPGG